jgi:glucose-6-phosphate-specific signal transduction histidine kinase
MCPFRILQETLSNAVKYSRASKVEVLLSATDSFCSLRSWTMESVSHGVIPPDGAVSGFWVWANGSD